MALPQNHLKNCAHQSHRIQRATRGGKNPAFEKRLKEAQASLDNPPSFGHIAREWLAHNTAQWSSKHLKRNEGLVRLYLLPDLGDAVDLIDERSLFAALKPAYDRGRKESARRARGIAAQIFQFALDTHRCKVNPTRDMAKNSYQETKGKTLGCSPLRGCIKTRSNSEKRRGAKVQANHRLRNSYGSIHGLRNHEIRGARWQEIDWNEKLGLYPVNE